MEDDSIINELFDKINNLEKNNEILRKDINKIKKEMFYLLKNKDYKIKM